MAVSSIIINVTMADKNAKRQRRCVSHLIPLKVVALLAIDASLSYSIVGQPYRVVKNIMRTPDGCANVTDIDKYAIMGLQASPSR